MATRTAAVQLPLGQLALLGAGMICVMNPDKFFFAVRETTRALMLPDTNASHQAAAPIVIHQAAAVPMGTSKVSTMIQLVIGAGCCWGSYVLLITILPESVKGMLPVTTSIFNKAVSSLGKAVINLKEVLMEQVAGLSKKQDELGEQQEETHSEVLNVKDSVGELKQDLTLIQESLDLCHSSLSESDKRTAYIAHGVQLLTRGVSTFLPQDDALLHELERFCNAGDEFKNPAQLDQMRQLIRNLQKHQENNNIPTVTLGQQAVLLSPSNIKGTTSTSQQQVVVPSSAENVERSFEDVKSLLQSMQCGTVM